MDVAVERKEPLMSSQGGTVLQTKATQMHGKPQGGASATETIRKVGLGQRPSMGKGKYPHYKWTILIAFDQGRNRIGNCTTKQLQCLTHIEVVQSHTYQSNRFNLHSSFPVVRKCGAQQPLAAGKEE